MGKYKGDGREAKERKQDGGFDGRLAKSKENEALDALEHRLMDHIYRKMLHRGREEEEEEEEEEEYESDDRIEKHRFQERYHERSHRGKCSKNERNRQPYSRADSREGRGGRWVDRDVGENQYKYTRGVEETLAARDWGKKGGGGWERSRSRRRSTIGNKKIMEEKDQRAKRRLRSSRSASAEGVNQKRFCSFHTKPPPPRLPKRGGKVSEGSTKQ